MTNKSKKTRVHPYVAKHFGEETYAELVAGTKQISINGTVRKFEDFKKIQIPDSAEVKIISGSAKPVESHKPEIHMSSKKLAEKIDVEEREVDEFPKINIKEKLGAKWDDIMSGKAVLSVDGQVIPKAQLAENPFIDKDKSYTILRAAQGG